jgi:hypothetical protein
MALVDKHWGQHDDDCFLCKLTSVSISGTAMPTRSPEVVQTKAVEKQMNRDLPAYKRLVESGVQPRSTKGAGDVETRATERFEVERGMVVNDHKLRNKVTETMKDMGVR